MLKTIRGIDNKNEFSVFVKMTYEIFEVVISPNEASGSMLSLEHVID